MFAIKKNKERSVEGLFVRFMEVDPVYSLEQGLNVFNACNEPFDLYRPLRRFVRYLEVFLGITVLITEVFD